MTPPVFGDLQHILNNYRGTPHLYFEIYHECNCEYCRVDNEEQRKCSACGKTEDHRNEFENKKGELQCPGCKRILVSQRDYNKLIHNKKKAYVVK